MNRYYYRYMLLFTAVFAALLIGLPAYRRHYKKITIEQHSSINRSASIHPDYNDTVIPPNIAPLNFKVQEDGKYYYVKIYSTEGKPIEIFSKKPEITIPEKSWHRLLDLNRGKPLYLEIFMQSQNDQWYRFQTASSRIAPEDIDRFVVYRKIHPGHALWKNIGIYQRDIESFNESVVLSNDFFKNDCVNCHTFCNNQSKLMSVAVRSKIYGSDTLLIRDAKAQKIGAKFTYANWHPSGKLVVFSQNKINQFFHSSREEIRDVIDMDSLLAYYIVDSKQVKSSDKFSRKDYLETYPVWSPDGCFLYFCSAPILWSDKDEIPPPKYSQVKYDLLRISYNVETDQWGELETVVSSNDTGLSASMPRISPDGKWLFLCMADYGCFNVYSQSSDLYIIDLEDAKRSSKFIPKRLDINSNKSESWHCWSSNSRWIIFSSKRDYGVFTRLYISYIDEDGNAYKPLILPQKDPLFYSSCLLTYNTPELTTQPVPVIRENLARIIRSPQKITVDMPITMATPKAEETSGYNIYQQRE